MQNINLSVLFLATQMPIWLGIVLAVVMLALGAIVGLLIYKSTTEKKVGSADERIKAIVSQAEAEAEKIKNQANLLA